VALNCELPPLPTTGPIGPPGFRAMLCWIGDSFGEAIVIAPAGALALSLV
jgi:hypothetical protein